MNSIEVIPSSSGYKAYYVTNIEPEHLEAFDIKFTVVKDKQISQYLNIDFHVFNDKDEWVADKITTTQRRLAQVASLNTKYVEGDTLYASVQNTFNIKYAELEVKDMNPIRNVPIDILLLNVLNNRSHCSIVDGSLDRFRIIRHANNIEVYSNELMTIVCNVVIGGDIGRMTLNSLPKESIEYESIDYIVNSGNSGCIFNNWSLLTTIEKLYRVGEPEHNLIELTDLRFKYNKVIAKRELELYSTNLIIAFYRFSYDNDSISFKCEDLDSEFIYILCEYISVCNSNSTYKKNK